MRFLVEESFWPLFVSDLASYLTGYPAFDIPVTGLVSALPYPVSGRIQEIISPNYKFGYPVHPYSRKRDTV